jgi:hypothetical protein
MSKSNQFENFPSHCRDQRQWCVYKDDTKKPYQSKHPDDLCDKTNLLQQSSFDEAVGCVQELTSLVKGPGYCIHREILITDLDNCLVDGKPELWALEYLEGMPKSYVEITPSGNGLHVVWFIDEADCPEHGCKEFFAPHKGAEVLVNGSYVTVTGNTIDGATPLPLAKLSKAQALILVARTKAFKALRTKQTGKFSEGSRHDALNDFAFKMRKQGHALPIITAATIQYDLEYCDPPKGSTYVRDKIIKGISSVATQQPRPPAVISNTREFAAKTFKPMEVLLAVKDSESEVLHHPTLGEIHAFRGVGKTNFAIGLLNCIATEGDFLAYHCSKARKVLWVDGEMSGADSQEILSALAEENENFNVISVEEQQDYTIPSIAGAEGLAWVEEAITRIGAEVVCLDSWSTLANVGTNEEEAWTVFMAWMKKMRLKGVTVFYLHHDGKGGKQRGHSKPEDLLNWVIQLTWVDGYKGAEGLKCFMHFEKARRPVKQCSQLNISMVETCGVREWAWSVPGATETPKKAAGRRPQQPTEEQKQWFQQFVVAPPAIQVQTELKVSFRVAQRWTKEWWGRPTHAEDVANLRSAVPGSFISESEFLKRLLKHGRMTVAQCLDEMTAAGLKPELYDMPRLHKLAGVESKGNYWYLAEESVPDLAVDPETDFDPKKFN